MYSSLSKVLKMEDFLKTTYIQLNVQEIIIKIYDFCEETNCSAYKLEYLSELVMMN